MSAGFDVVFVSTMWHDGNHGEYFGLDMMDDANTGTSGNWKPIISKTQLQGHAAHWYLLSSLVPLIDKSGGKTRFRFRNYPDGGISRLGLYDST